MAKRFAHQKAEEGTAPVAVASRLLETTQKLIGEVTGFNREYADALEEFVATPLHWYSRAMREVLRKELAGKFAVPDIDKAPDQFSLLMKTLRVFDLASECPASETMVNALLPSLEQFLTQKYV